MFYDELCHCLTLKATIETFLLSLSQAQQEDETSVTENSLEILPQGSCSFMDSPVYGSRFISGITLHQLG